MNDKVTDSLLNSKTGKKVVEHIGSKKPQLLDDVTNTLTEGTKQNVNYGIGRASKPAYDSTMGTPIQEAVDWTVGGEESKPQAKQSQSSAESAAESK